ncbi:phage major capsid protein [Paraburkholderia youngii]|uniref:Phage major capsid protein n=1 Tax=Paraburkholderia youngii TaxID=2782701 RepID=A0A7Y6JZU9_9BURK|nr:phage major capsid protein [Paraburkholderia youngii]NUY01557.1 phage major capsid protein [Paraburkholderia youngii]
MADHGLVRLVAALAAGGSSGLSGAHAWAVQRWGDTATVTRALRFGLDTGNLGGVDYAALANGFVPLLAADSIIERLDALVTLRRVPFFTPLAREKQPARVEWSAQGTAKLIADISLEPFQLAPRKVAGAVIATTEALRQAGREPLERTIAASLTTAYALAEGEALLSASAGNEAVPTGLLHGVTPVHASGTTAQALAADVRALLADFTGNLARCIWIANAGDAVALALLDVTFTADVRATGGTLAGLPLVASPAAPAGSLVLLDSSALVVASDPLTVDVASEAALDVADSAGATGTLALWQVNMSCVLLERRINWMLAQAGGVAVIDNLFASPPDAAGATEVARHGRRSAQHE